MRVVRPMWAAVTTQRWVAGMLGPAIAAAGVGAAVAEMAGARAVQVETVQAGPAGTTPAGTTETDTKVAEVAAMEVAVVPLVLAAAGTARAGTGAGTGIVTMVTEGWQAPRAVLDQETAMVRAILVVARATLR